MKAMTRFVSVFLAVIMLLSFSISNLCIVAADGEGTSGTTSGETTDDKALSLEKWFTPATNEDGTEDWSHGMLTLEAFATGTKVTTEKHQPIAAVLVLDVSGSMDTEMKKEVGSLGHLDDLDTSKTYSFSAYNVECKLQYRKGSWKYQGIRGGWNDIPELYISNNYTVYLTETRLDALKTAVDSFIDTIYADAAANNVEHKIAIVKFASASYYSNNHLTVGNHVQSNNSNYNYTELIASWTTVNTEANATSLKTTVNSLTAAGATAADYGMTIANEELADLTNNVTDAGEYAKMALMFTDGSPTHSSDFSSSVANNAIAQSKIIKDSGAAVYTVGIITNASTNVTTYMNAVSSNYPKATSMTNTGARGTGDYYKDATNADLSEIFKNIAEDTLNAAVNLTEEACLMDEVTEFFEIPQDVAPEDVIVKTAAWLGGNDYSAVNGWGDPIVLATAQVTIDNSDETAKNRVYVTGFNYKEEACALGLRSGSKLIIQFPIALRAPAEVDAETQGKFQWNEEHQAYVVPTNTTLAGIYTSKSLAEKVEDAPELEGFVPGTTYLDVVTYVVDITIDGAIKTEENWTAPSLVYADVKPEQVYKQFVVLEGDATPAVADPSVYGYSFEGWTPAVAETVTGSPVYVATWKPLTFQVYHSSNKTTETFRLIDVLPTATSTNTFNITALVRSGYIYGGVFENAEYKTAKTYIESEGDNGLAFVPKAGETYYLKEVSKYLYNGNSFITVNQPQPYSGTTEEEEIRRVTNIYALVSLDCDQYLGYGVDHYAMTKEEMDALKADKTYVTTSVDNSEYVALDANSVWSSVSVDGKVVKQAKDGEYIGVIDLKFNGFYANTRPYGGQAIKYVKDAAFMINSYWVTMDGVKVTNRYGYFYLPEGATKLTMAITYDFNTTVCTVFENGGAL